MKEKEDKFVIKERIVFREFLNEDEGLASIETDVDFDSWRYNNKNLHVTIQGTVNIHDCSRSISLDFSADTSEEYKAARNKIKTLLDAFKQLDKDLSNKYRMGQRLLKDFKEEVK